MRARLRALGERGEHVGGLVHPAPLLDGVGEHLPQRGREPECTVAGGERRFRRLSWPRRNAGRLTPRTGGGIAGVGAVSRQAEGARDYGRFR